MDCGRRLITWHRPFCFQIEAFLSSIGQIEVPQTLEEQITQAGVFALDYVMTSVTIVMIRARVPCDHTRQHRARPWTTVDDGNKNIT